MRKTPTALVAPIAAILLAATSARADIDVDWGAYLENDLRLAVDRVDEIGFNRNETALGVGLKAGLMPDRLRFVGDLKFVWVGFTTDTEFEGLTTRASVSPYYLESSAAYIEVISLFPWVDVRIGRQVVQWGAADMFNPTNNLNALDLEDPIKFGETVANEMIRVDWNPEGGDFVLTAVWVPLFQPALLPQSALLAIGDPTSKFPFVDPAVRRDAEKLRNVWLSNDKYYVVDQPTVNADMPEFSLENSQFAVKAQWLVGMFDMSISYFQGFDTIPVPASSESSTHGTGRVTDDGTPILGVASDVRVVYPEKKVLGFDMAGQLPFLDDAGIWFEGAFVFPEEVVFEFDVSKVAAGARVLSGPSVKGDPYFQCTLGMDYTINKYIFVNAQYLHGFVDEFGSSHIHDYWVAGFDLKFMQERLLVRIFGIGEIPHEDDDLNLDEDGDGNVDSFAIGATNDGTISSYVIHPSIAVKPMDGLELALGGYFLFGHDESKFAQPAAGPSLAFLRAKASF